MKNVIIVYQSFMVIVNEKGQNNPKISGRKLWNPSKRLLIVGFIISVIEAAIVSAADFAGAPLVATIEYALAAILKVKS